MAEGALGSTLAGCRLEAVAGRGGMGVVYRATQLALRRSVALKAIAPQLAEDAAYRERFQQESELAASIDHPNVIPVYEAGELDGTLYLIMRWVDGTDLRQLLSSCNRLSPARAVRLLRPVASALAAAHRRGLVHRDIKPGNVLIARGEGEEDEHVYLTDFGIARRTDAEGAMTRTGVLVGTMDYLAPERIEGGRGTAASDIYAFGCMLFESLAGRLPFDGPTEVMRMHAHLTEPVPSVRDEVPEVPPSLDQIVTKAMAKRPEDRFESAAALAAALGRALDDPGSPTDETEIEIEATVLDATVAADPPSTEPITAAAAPPAPAPPPTTLPDDRPDTVPKPPVRRPRSRLLLAAPVVAIAIVAIAVAVLSGGGGNSHQNSASSKLAAPTVSGQPVSISGPIPLPRGTDPVALWGDGSTVLVAGSHGVLRVGAHGKIQDFPTDGQPTDVAVDGGGRVWVTEKSPDKVLVFSGAVAKPVPLSETPASISMSPHAAWIASTGSGSVTRVDLSTLAPSTVNVVGTVAAIGEAYGRLWVASAGGGLVALDEAGNPTLPGPQLPPGTIAIGHSDGLWFLSTSGVLTRVDPRLQLAVGGHYREHPNQFTVPNPIPSIASLQSNHLIWVGSSSGPVIRLATTGPENNHPVTTLNFHAAPGQLAARSGVLWVAIPSRNELYRVAFS